MNATAPTSTRWRHSVAFYALLPAVLFASIVLSWCALWLSVYAGVVMIAPPLGLPLLLLLLVGGYALFAWLASWVDLARAGPARSEKPARNAGVAVGCVLALALALSMVMRVRERGYDEYTRWIVVALFLYAATGVFLLIKHLSNAPARPSLRLTFRLLIVAGTWIASAAAIAGAPALLDNWIRLTKVQASRKIHLDSYEPLATALCASDLDRARAILTRPGYEASPWPAIQCISTLGWVDEQRTGLIFFPERVPVVLDAILAYERQNGIASTPGCTQLQAHLLGKLVAEHPASLVLYRDRGLSIDCTTDDERRTPRWWSIVYGRGVELTELTQLVSLDIDPLQRDASGAQLLGSNSNSFVWKASTDTLLKMVELGMELQAPDHRSPHLAVEVMWRRFDRAAPGGEALEKLAALTGEPTYEQVIESAKVNWYEFLTRANDDRYEHRGVRAYIAKLRDAAEERDDLDPDALARVLDYLAAK